MLRAIGRSDPSVDPPTGRPSADGSDRPMARNIHTYIAFGPGVALELEVVRG